MLKTKYKLHLPRFSKILKKISQYNDDLYEFSTPDNEYLHYTFEKRILSIIHKSTGDAVEYFINTDCDIYFNDKEECDDFAKKYLKYFHKEYIFLFYFQHIRVANFKKIGIKNQQLVQSIIELSYKKYLPSEINNFFTCSRSKWIYRNSLDLKGLTDDEKFHFKIHVVNGNNQKNFSLIIYKKNKNQEKTYILYFDIYFGKLKAIETPVLFLKNQLLFTRFLQKIILSLL